MDASGTETVEADTAGPVTLSGAGVPEVAQAPSSVQPLPGRGGGHQLPS